MLELDLSYHSEPQKNHSILNDRKQYHYENEVSYIDLNKANHIRLVRTFFDELK